MLVDLAHLRLDMMFEGEIIVKYHQYLRIRAEGSVYAYIRKSDEDPAREGIHLNWGLKLMWLQEKGLSLIHI